MDVPDSLHEKLELFRRRGRVVKYREGVFLDASWIAVYLGQRVIPAGPRSARRRRRRPTRSSRGMAMLHGRDQGDGRERMPDHVAHIARYCPMATAA